MLQVGQLLPSTVPSLTTPFSLLHIRNVGAGRVEGGPEQIELQRLSVSLVGLGTGGRVGLGVGAMSGSRLRFEQALDFLHRLPWLRSLLGRGGAGGLMLEPS